MSAPIVFVHGFATSHQRTWVDNGWTHLVADAGRTAVGIDLLGHGSAPKPHDPAAYDRFEDHVVDALPDEAVDVISFSLGARTILSIASRSPERFSRIVVAGVGANLFDSARHDEVVAAIEGDAPDDSPVAQYFSSLADDPDSDREALSLVMRRAHPPITAEGLAEVACPVLVVLGDRDFAGPADPLVDALPNATFCGLRGVDHFSTPKDFGFIDAALDFLDAQPF